MGYTARKRDTKSEVWNKLLLLLSSLSPDDDKALCTRCGKELSAASRSGTSHLLRHSCGRNEEERLGWGMSDAVDVLQAKPPGTVDAVQWRQGQDTVLLLRQEPLNWDQLRRKGLRVYLLPDLERRLQDQMKELEGLLLPQQQPGSACPDETTRGGGEDARLKPGRKNLAR